MFLVQVIKYTQFTTMVRQDKKRLEEKCFLVVFPTSTNIHIWDNKINSPHHDSLGY